MSPLLAAPGGSGSESDLIGAWGVCPITVLSSRSDRRHPVHQEVFSMAEILPAYVVVGVDTHKHIHAAVAVSALGARLGAMTVAVGEKGYRQLEAWARSLGPVHAFGVEGTGSFGAGLSRFLSSQLGWQ